MAVSVMVMLVDCKKRGRNGCNYEKSSSVLRRRKKQVKLTTLPDNEYAPFGPEILRQLHIFDLQHIRSELEDVLCLHDSLSKVPFGQIEQLAIRARQWNANSNVQNVLVTKSTNI